VTAEQIDRIEDVVVLARDEDYEVELTLESCDGPAAYLTIGDDHEATIRVTPGQVHEIVATLAAWLGKHETAAAQEATARRVDILEAVHEATPVGRTYREIERELGDRARTWPVPLAAEIRALERAGLLVEEPECTWKTSDTFDDELVDAGFRALAARSVGR
jgi:hypothetical protein